MYDSIKTVSYTHLLAYPIQYLNDGYYVLMTFEADPTLPAELERNYKISDDVLRYMVVNLEDQKA